MTDATAPTAPIPDEPPDADKSPPPKRSVVRRALRGLMWMMCIALVIGVAGAGLAFTLPGQSFQAPAWVEERVERRLQELLPDHQVRVQRMRVAFEQDLRPRIGLQDVELTDNQGLTRLTLNDIDLGVSITAAVQGQVQARDLHVSGVVVAVGRGRDGTFDFSFGQSGTTRAEFSDLSSAIAALTGTFGDPRFDRMRRIVLDGLTIRYDDARAGRNWTVDGGRVEAMRSGEDVVIDGSFSVLGGRSYAASLDAKLTTSLNEGSVAFELGVADFAAQDLATQSPALAWLDVLRASISGTLAGEVASDGTLAPLSASLELGEGAVQPTEATQPIPFRAARTAFLYYPDTGRIGFTDFDLDSAWLSVGGAGQVLLGDIENGLPRDYTGQFQLTRVAGNPGDLFAAEQALEGADLDLKVTLEPFEVVLGQALIRDPDVPVRATARVAAGPNGWLYGIEAFADALSVKRVMDLWPAAFQTRARDWVSANVQRGDLSNVQFAMRGEGKAREDRELYLGFGFDNAVTKVMKTLPPISGGSGQFTLHNRRLAVSTESGYVEAPQGGKITLGGSQFVMPDVRKRPSPANITLTGEGPISAVLSMLDQKPFQFLTKAKQPVTLAKTGRISFDGSLALPLKRKIGPGEVQYAFTGTARDVQSDTLVKGRVLKAPSLAVNVDNDGIRVAGKGNLSGVAFDGAWSQPLGKAGAPGDVMAKVTLTDAGLRAFGITLPKGTLSGTGRGDLSITLAKGRAPSFALTSNLAGLGVKVAPIAWRLSQKQTGKFSIAGALTEPARIDRISLDAPGLRASGAIDLTDSGGFRSARLDRVRAGGWLDSAVTLTSRGRNTVPAISVRGGRLDMRTAPIGSGGGASGSGAGEAPLNIAVDRLTISEGIRLQPFQGTFTMGKGLTGAFRGNINGDALVEGKVGPDRNATGFEITSKNAGRALSAAGLLKRAAGGALRLKMRPVQGRVGHYDGKLEIDNTRLKDAPGIAALLSSLSVVGLLEQMSGEGIHFASVEADFRLTPDRAIVTKSSAVGPSMGISMDGFYRLRDGYMDMRGVVSPIYLINGIGSLFSRNREGLFGFNYWIKGTADNPRVGVNPMSILTPGMFRDLFRRPPPKVK